MKKNLLWLVPLCLVFILAGTILAIPAFVASGTHRGNIEALASSLTGRTVHISGKLSLALFPSPLLSATRVTITGPDAETISARSLTLNISLPALLRGRLVAENINLDAPDIVFPWPLPGGAKAIAPPSWLAALHAHIGAGRISLGAARFSNVNADIVTGADSAVTVSGNGVIFGQNVALTLGIGAGQLTGAAPLTVDAASGGLTLHFKGTLDPQSVLAGQLHIAAPQFAGSANLAADGGTARATQMQFSAGKASLTGSASFSFAHPAITAALNVRNLDLDTLPLTLPPIPVSVTLTASNISFLSQSFPGVTGEFDASPSGAHARNVQVALPASATLSADGGIDSTGALAGRFSLASPDLPGLLAAYGFAPPAGWTAASLSAGLAGTTGNIAFTGISGTLGPSHVTGNVTLAGRHAAGALDFDRLDLLPILDALGRLPAGAFTADGQITAANGSLGPIPLQHLLFDGSLDHGLVLRRVSANVFDGLAAGSVSLDASGQISAARGFVFLPSAAPLAALLPAGWQLPAAIVKPRLNAAISAQAKSGWLATTLAATLGDFAITAAPSLNLASQTVQGALTLRHPDAIAAFKLAGLPGALAWPGPGSISLRASFIASPARFGLQDFVLSLGNLTTNGRLLSQQGVLAGSLDAGVLALPPFAAGLQIPWNSLASAKGSLDISAGRVLYDGNTILLGSAGQMKLAPESFTFKLAHAALAGGDASGSFSAVASATAPPAITATFSATGVDAAQLALPLKFPLGVSAGTLGGSANLTASGYEPKVWLATLGGTASLSGANGTLTGFDLAGLAKALTSKTPSADLRKALSSGATSFSKLALGVTLSHGNAEITAASLAGPDGAANATGSVDIFDQDVAIHLALQPDVSPPIDIETTMLGAWAAPRFYPKLKPALAWRPGK